MDIKTQVEQMGAMVKQGAIVDAVKTFFSESANTSDYNNVTTNNKSQMIQKMEGFVGNIANVNGITHHKSIVDNQVSASEFTFDFDMKDGSKVLWHEIIQRTWDDQGKVKNEEYFLA